jgi:HEPN domain-containing protein
MREIDEGQRWLEQAKEDLKWVRLLLAEGGFHLVCFLSQQVAEKALKAILYAQGEEMVLGHSVERLGAQVSLHLPKIREQAVRWAVLDGYYVTTRYPNSLPGSIPARVYQKDAAQEALSLAEEVVIFVEEQLR